MNGCNGLGENMDVGNVLKIKGFLKSGLVGSGRNPRLDPRDSVDCPWVDLRSIGLVRRPL